MIREIHEKLISKEISTRELAEEYIGRIRKMNHELNAFVHIAEQEALRAADRADEMIHRGEATLLTGIPFAVKDNFCVQGMPTTAASKMLQNYVPPYTATSVQRLLDEGAVLLGKTNMDEFAMGSSTEHSFFGATKNAHDTSRVPGGTSGGSATAVAASLCVFALGTDTGGSIRQPAALSGVVGLKVTYGRVSRFGVIAMASSLDTIGPLTNTCEDAGVVFRVMAGRDPYDSTTAKEPLPSEGEYQAANLAGLKIGIPKEYAEIEGVQPEVQEAIAKARKIFEKNGAKIQEVSLPYSSYAIPVYYVIVPSEVSSNLARYDGTRYGYVTQKAKKLQEIYELTRSEGFGTEAKRRIMLGTFALSAGYHDAYYKQAQKVRTLITEDFAKAFETVDALLAPAVPNVAFPLGEKLSDPLTMYLQDIYTAPASLAGVAALSLPTGESTEIAGKKLPIGMQIIGPRLEEHRILGIGTAYEAAQQDAEE